MKLTIAVTMLLLACCWTNQLAEAAPAAASTATIDILSKYENLKLNLDSRKMRFDEKSQQVKKEVSHLPKGKGR